jgi:predicted esterase
VEEHRLPTTRRARYFTVGGDGGAPSEAWIVVHGYGQLAAPFLRNFEGVARPHRVIVAPEALNRYYVREGTRGTRGDARVGATWMTQEDRENEIADYVDFLDAVREEAVPPAARLTVLGFSQGAATAVRWLQQGRARVACLVVWAGQLPHDADLAALRERLGEGGVVLVEGMSDDYAAWIRDGHNAERLAEAGIPHRLLGFDGGHRLDEALLTRLAAD